MYIFSLSTYTRNTLLNFFEDTKYVFANNLIFNYVQSTVESNYTLARYLRVYA